MIIVTMSLVQYPSVSLAVILLEKQRSPRSDCFFPTVPHNAVGNVSDCRYVSDCRFRGQEFDPGKVPYFRGDCCEIISTAILLPSADSRRIVVSYK